MNPEFVDLYQKLLAIDVLRLEDHETAEREYQKRVSAAWAEWAKTADKEAAMREANEKDAYYAQHPPEGGARQ